MVSAHGSWLSFNKVKNSLLFIFLFLFHIFFLSSACSVNNPRLFQGLDKEDEGKFDALFNKIIINLLLIKMDILYQKN